MKGTKELNKFRIAPHKTVRITQKHIDEGVRRNSRTCAISSALAEAGALRPQIHRGRISFTINNERFTYVCPPTMASFITDWDNGRKGKEHGPAVRPQTFRLREGRVRKSQRTGGPDRTQKARHQPGGRAARRGYTGPRAVAVTSTRLDGFAMITT